mgnify:CR=1 FL=1
MPTVNEFNNEAKNICDQIVRIYQPEKVILFGSLGRGHLTPTDIDLLVIKNTKENKIKRAQNLYRQLIWSLPLDIIVRTPAEIESGINSGSPFFKNALAGKVIYETSRG